MHVCGNSASWCASSSAAARLDPDRHDPVDEPIASASSAPTPPARQHHVHRPADADQPRQPHGAAVDQRNPPAPAEHAEHGVLLGHAQVAPQRQLEPARHRMTRDRRDHRLAQHQSASAPSDRRRPQPPDSRPQSRPPSDRRPRRTRRPRRAAPPRSARDRRRTHGKRQPTLTPSRRRPRCAARDAIAAPCRPARRARPGPPASRCPDRPPHERLQRRQDLLARGLAPPPAATAAQRAPPHTPRPAPPPSARRSARAAPRLDPGPQCRAVSAL